MHVESIENFSLFLLHFRVIELYAWFIITLSTWLFTAMLIVANFINTVLISCKVNNFTLKILLKSVENPFKSLFTTYGLQICF